MFTKIDYSTEDDSQCVPLETEGSLDDTSNENSKLKSFKNHQWKVSVLVLKTAAGFGGHKNGQCVIF